MPIKIIITDGINTIDTASNPDFDITINDVATTVQMANGKTVQDLIGYKYVLTIPPGLLTVEQLKKLWKMRYNSSKVSITFPTIFGIITRDFIISISPYRPAKYADNNVAYWNPPTIIATQVDIEK